MKTMILAVAGALLLAGCGGGSKGGSVAALPSGGGGTPTPTWKALSLEGTPANPETPETPTETPGDVTTIDVTTIAPGQTGTVSLSGRSINVRCPNGGLSCHVGVVDGSVWYRLDGGVPFVEVQTQTRTPPTTPTPPETPRLPAGTPRLPETRTFTLVTKELQGDTTYKLRRDTTYILLPGSSWKVQVADGVMTVFTCPGPGGPLCEIYPFYVAGSTTFTQVRFEEIDPNVPIFIAHAPTHTTITGLPAGHTLTSRTLAPGASVTVAPNAVLSCSGFGADCVITVTASGVTATGGIPIVRLLPPGTSTTPTAITGLPTGHILTTMTIPAGWSMLAGGHIYLSCPSGGPPCIITVAADGTVTSIGGTPVVHFTIAGLRVGVAGYGRWSRTDLIATSLVQDRTGARLVLNSAYHQFSPSREATLTFQGNAYSTDGLTGQINLQYNRGTVDASINDSQSRNLFRMSGIPVTGANFWKVDGTDRLEGAFIRRRDGTGVDRTAGIASTSTCAMVFDVPKTSR